MLKVINSNSRVNLVNLCCHHKRFFFSEGQRQAINKEVVKLLEKGALVKAQHCPGVFISNLFLVLKKTGDLGPVINLKPFMYKFIVKRHFKIETISVARELINRNDYLASADLPDAYFKISIHESYREFPRFIWKEQFTSLFAFRSGIVYRGPEACPEVKASALNRGKFF